MTHIHADHMMQYAYDATETEYPWLRWQFKHPRGVGWQDCTAHPLWCENEQYRRVENSRGDYEFPTPYRGHIENSLTVYSLCISPEGRWEVLKKWWVSNEITEADKAVGLVHLTEGAAKAHAAELNRIHGVK